MKQTRQIEIVKLMISKGANNWNGGMFSACHNNHTDIVQLMISKGANNLDWGLFGACKGGHIDLVNMMLQKGANDWNLGLIGACQGGHLDIIKLMLEKGAEPLSEYKIPLKIPKDDQNVKLIYSSLYDYLPDVMINEILKYSTVEDFNLLDWLKYKDETLQP